MPLAERCPQKFTVALEASHLRELFIFFLKIFQHCVFNLASDILATERGLLINVIVNKATITAKTKRDKGIEEGVYSEK